MTVLEGSRPVPGREYRWLELPANKPERQVFNAVMNAGTHATAGGVIDSDQRILTPDGRTFLGISYKGDIEGWRLDIEEGATGQGLLVAAVQGTRLICTNGSGSYELSECELFNNTKP